MDGDPELATARPAVRVDVAPSDLVAVPGQPTLVFVTIFNASGVIDGFTVGLDGDDELVAAADPAVLSLFPDSEGTVALSITPGQHCTAGRHDPVVTITSEVADVVVLSQPIAVEVAAVALTTVTLEPQSVTGGSSGRFSVVAANAGNVPVAVSFDARDPERALRARFSASEVVIGPAERVSVPFVVRGRRPFLGAPVPRIVSVLASTTPSIPTSEPAPPLEAVGTFVQKPVLPRALLTLAALLLALGLWAAVLLQGVDRAATQVAEEVANVGTSTIVGRVTDGRSGLGGVVVSAAGPTAAVTTTLSAGDVGTFTLRGLEGDGVYVLTLAKDGFTPITYEVPVPPGEGAVVSTGTIVLGRGAAAVSGTVADDVGVALGDVSVTIQSDGEVIARAATASSGAVGYYSIGGLAAGAYTLTFERFGYTPSSVQVQVEQEAVVTADAQLQALATGTMSGVVTAAIARSPACGQGPSCGLGGVMVEAMVDDQVLTAMSLSGPAGSEGAWTIGGLPAGTYTVTFSRAGFEPEVVSVSVGVDQSLAIDVTLRGVPGSIAGTATECRAVEVRFRDLTRPAVPISAVPGADGSFTLGQLPTPGEYRLVFDGPVLRTLDVDLGPGEVRSVTESCAAASAPAPTTTTATTAPTTTTAPFSLFP